MDPKWRQKFTNHLLEHDVVFNPTFQGYSGPVKANVNMGPVQPPQRKGKMPLYNTNNLDELQNKFDELERLGVFRKPEKMFQ